jgi:hypothetical protein
VAKALRGTYRGKALKGNFAADLVPIAVVDPAIKPPLTPFGCTTRNAGMRGNQSGGVLIAADAITKCRVEQRQDLQALVILVV